MKRIIYFFILIITITSCAKDLVKWEFSRKPIINEAGDFSNSGLIIHKTISKNDIIAKLDLQDAELKTLKITYADVILNLLNVPQADSIKFELFCDAIPFKPSHTGVVAIKPGSTTKILNEEKIKLGSVSLQAINLVNTILDNVINNGQVIKFDLVARTVPGGALIEGKAEVSIYFDATIWKCIQKPTYAVFEKDKGPCN